MELRTSGGRGPAGAGRTVPRAPGPQHSADPPENRNPRRDPGATGRGPESPSGGYGAGSEWFRGAAVPGPESFRGLWCPVRNPPGGCGAGSGVLPGTMVPGRDPPGATAPGPESFRGCGALSGVLPGATAAPGPESFRGLWRPIRNPVGGCGARSGVLPGTMVPGREPPGAVAPGSEPSGDHGARTRILPEATGARRPQAAGSRGPTPSLSGVQGAEPPRGLGRRPEAAPAGEARTCRCRGAAPSRPLRAKP